MENESEIKRIYLKEWFLSKLHLKFNRKYLDIIEVKKETEKAILVMIHPIFVVYHNIRQYIWIPKSSIIKNKSYKGFSGI